MYELQQQFNTWVEKDDEKQAAMAGLMTKQLTQDNEDQ